MPRNVDPNLFLLPVVFRDQLVPLDPLDSLVALELR